MAQEIGIGLEFKEDPALQTIRAKVDFAKERVALAEARLRLKVEQYQKEKKQ